ncbi:hypothetical protein PTE30175_02113 [Pandoraea terrae]|uniref:VWFA domain-containing protein n=1 Tax=Pandoraea terrae TaxID=1537710 RepID=A0A5E4USZ6_9BURK|nr:VWA domain-containing protein [Pandoraea terrae]VVE02035.1 hypothetical protein PTE30175_02113 [Pandoraea terrae]
MTDGTFEGDGRLAENVMHFARVLRIAGLPIGPAHAADALMAVSLVGVARRDDWHAALASVLVTRRDQQAIFDQAFAVFWRDPDLLARAARLPLPKIAGRLAGDLPVSPRVSHALAPRASQPDAARTPSPRRTEFEAMATFSERERLMTRDFEQMTPQEWAEARRWIARFAMPFREIVTRRWQAGGRGRIDLRAALRERLRQGGELQRLPHRQRVRRPPPIVALCDISGSMHRYTRVLLHFLHALGRRESLSVFLFGTRLTDVTRCLRARDVDDAMRAVARAVPDWSGGTRIGPCLQTFHRQWARRLLARRAAVLLVTDGLDRGDPAVLGEAMARLRLCSRQILWLNPLLRYAGFAPKAGGVRAMLPWVDRHLPVHDLASLAQLSQALGRHAC